MEVVILRIRFLYFKHWRDEEKSDEIADAITSTNDAWGIVPLGYIQPMHQQILHSRRW
jgi:hypothetical protein